MPKSFDDLMEIFARARVLELEERSSWLDSRCGVDSDLRRQIDDLLEAHDEAHDGVVDSTGVSPDVVGELDRADVTIPDTVGDYRVVERIGAGGMGSCRLPNRQSPAAASRSN